jgi:hypothetical protein
MYDDNSGIIFWIIHNMCNWIKKTLVTMEHNYEIRYLEWVIRVFAVRTQKSIRK